MATKSQVQEEPKPQVIEETLAFQEMDISHALAALKQSSGGTIEPRNLFQMYLPNGRSIQFDSDGKPQSTVTGIVLTYHAARTKYRLPFGEGGNKERPICTSEDGVTGVGNPGGSCATCIYAQFEHPRETKCALFYRLYLLPLDAPLPIHLRIPLMNMSILKNHFQKEAGKTGKFTYELVTEFSLATKDANIPYPIIQCKTVGFLNPVAVKAITGYAESLQGQFTAPQITQGSTAPKESLPLFTEVPDDEPEDIPF